ncbi:MAG: adenosine kinase [Pseudomonadota bacterium]|nr:adenosine kinase [Pseudomonadota bacterium]
MTDTRYDVLTIGNAIVDVLSRTDDGFLVDEGLTKGMMRLIDAEEAERLYDRIGPAVEISGGCAGNTAAGVASFGGRAAFIGKVAEDALGRIYAHDIRAAGVAFRTPPIADGAPTARCLILVTPDGERTMNTYLGACQALGPDDVDEDTVAAARITYLEGYLWDTPQAKEAFRKAAEIARRAGRRVALTLSDSFCVDRWRDEFRGLVEGGTIDVLFANESEAKALYQTASLDAAVAALRETCPLTAVTLGPEGSLVVTREETQQVRAVPVDRVVDTTGAGDLYAAGFLYGLATGRELPDCARLGGLAAAEIIGHIGARPETSLKALAEQNGLAG